MRPPCFLFRLDVSPQVGMGHLRRCMNLARLLKKRGVDPFFLCRARDMDLSGHLAPVATDWALCDWFLTPLEDAAEVVRFSGQHGIDAAVIDHYRIDEAYQKSLREAGIRWMQFDGAARYPFWSDWVINMSPAARQSLYEPLRRRRETQFLLGPQYAVLREEFHLHRPRQRQWEHVKTILLTFGGGDDRGATLFCLEALRTLDHEMERIVLLSGANPHREQILRWKEVKDGRITIVENVEETAPYMDSADIAITAAGTTTFEAAALGVPVIMLAIADNQVPIASAWQQCGYGVDLGPLADLDAGDLQRAVSALIGNPEQRKAMSAAGRSMVDGLGAQRVADVLIPGITHGRNV